MRIMKMKLENLMKMKFNKCNENEIRKKKIIAKKIKNARQASLLQHLE